LTCWPSSTATRRITPSMRERTATVAIASTRPTVSICTGIGFR
jgi:hypothetical protein